jgi:hypothetical protein
MKARRPNNHIAAENLALFEGRRTGYRATVVIHCLDGRGTSGLVTVQTFYPMEDATDAWLLAGLRILAGEAQRRGLLKDAFATTVDR